MLDEKGLQTTGESVDTPLSEDEARIMAMLHERFDPKFQYLFDLLKGTEDKLTPAEARADIPEAAAKQHSHETEVLEKPGNTELR